MKADNQPKGRQALSRRTALKSSTLAALTAPIGWQLTNAQTNQLATEAALKPQDNAGIVFHWDTNKPFDYGVMDRPDNGIEVLRPNALVTKANFQRRPYNVYFHQHPGKLVNVHPVSRGFAPVTELLREPANELINAVAVEDSQGNPISFAKHLKNHFTDAIVVLHDGVLRMEEYFSGMKPESVHYLWSATKTVTAAVIWNLLGNGDLQRDKQLSFYVPWLRDCPLGSATIDQLLKMQSGIRWDLVPDDSPQMNLDAEEHMTSQADLAVEYRAQGLYPRLPSEPDTFGIHDFLLSLNQIRPHGRVFSYKNPDTYALCEACRAVSGKTIADLTEELIWNRLGVERDALYHYDVRGTPASAGGLAATARDMARFGEMLRNDGFFNGQQIVPRGTINRITREHEYDKITEGGTIKRSALGPDRSYNDHTWIWLREKHRLSPAISANGYQGQLVYVDPHFKTVIVKFSSWTPPKRQIEMANTEINAFRRVAEALTQNT